jgi:hypothetical protein
MVRQFVRFGSCVTIACVVCGCSVLFSFDGYAGSSDADSLEASAFDSSAADAGTDACPGFCDDFDDRTTVLGNWASLDTLGGTVSSSASITSADFKSPPHAAQFHVIAHSSGSDQGALVHVVRPLSAGAMAVDFDVKVITTSSGFAGALTIAQFALGGQYAGSITQTGTTFGMDSWVPYADGGHVQHYQPAPSPSGDSAWHHVHFEAVYDTVAGSVFSTWDGVTVLNVKQSVTWTTLPIPSTFEFRLGGLSKAPTPTMDVYVDNVVVR